MLMKLANGGSGWDINNERNKEKKMGRMARGKKCDISVKLDSTAVSIDGIRRSRSHEHACRIRAKKTTAIEKPTICINNNQWKNYWRWIRIHKEDGYEERTKQANTKYVCTICMSKQFTFVNQSKTPNCTKEDKKNANDI